jgi:hypothetical protein
MKWHMTRTIAATEIPEGKELDSPTTAQKHKEVNKLGALALSRSGLDAFKLQP